MGQSIRGGNPVSSPRAARFEQTAARMPPRSARTVHASVAEAPHAAGGLACVQILGQGCGRPGAGEAGGRGGLGWAGLGWAGLDAEGQAWAG